jgi:TRAP transporter 4TM/12TM fusion protein
MSSEAETPTKGLSRWANAGQWVISLLAGVFSLVFLAFAIDGGYETYQHRTIFLTFCLVLAYALRSPTGRSPRSKLEIVLDGICIVLAIAAGTYGALYHDDILQREGNPVELDIWVGGVLIILTLEATRRTAGLALTIIACTLLAYVYFGPYLPTMIAHAGYDFPDIIAANYMSDQGMYGVILGVTADFIFLFVIFGALLEGAGAVNRFNDLSQSIMGRQTGGPAKTAVLASGLMGSISGSAVANVVTTGTFTIPMMRKLGYPPAFAGAVEAAASTGGQIMPPIMGATAFVIAATLGVPYIAVAKAALVPATLYFFSVGMAVHFMSHRLNLRGLPRDQLPKFLPSLRSSMALLLPLVVIIWVMMRGYSVIFAGLAGIASIIAISWLRSDTRLTPRKLFASAQMAGRNIVGVGLACATAGLIANAIAISGAGMRISSITMFMGNIHLLLALVFAMFACLILGMGMPTVAAYVIVSTLGAPTLVNLGMPQMATHMFVFFFAIICNVTPPVALAAFAAAPLAGMESKAWKVGVEAFKLALSGFIVPYFFIFNSALLLEGSLYAIVISVSTALLGVIALSASTMGFFKARCNVLERIILFGVALGLLYHDIWINLASGAVMAGLYYLQKQRAGRSAVETTARATGQAG